MYNIDFGTEVSVLTLRISIETLQHCGATMCMHLRNILLNIVWDALSDQKLSHYFFLTDVNYII